MMHEKDFKEGIDFLKKTSSKVGLYSNISNCRWIIPLSKILSEYEACKEFWVNTYLQNNIIRISKCVKISDIFHGYGVYLFEWERTPQGHLYWANIANIIFNMTKDKKLLIEL
jgi:hypothetical protein